MSLSSDLISQFVKVTNDKTETKKETTVYGTTIKYKDTMYVKIDGSELLTPISSTADVKENERVTVMIKNHTATVTGNLTSPAARSDDVKDIADAARKISEFEIIIADKASVEALEAEIARIDSLSADNVIIKNQLKTNTADIAELKADNVTISGSLTAAEADITKIKTDKLDAEIAEATYATIKDLNATNADVNNLEASYGNINSLIFGSATGTSIQTSFSNAVIAQLGDAQIKSAMIESIAASKITSGDIITNNVRVKSQNGLLLISDETIQISDNTRVRVQVGKDAAGDYSINIWDADGKLMFSEGGITDSAIKDAIIRNDMVSDTANIAAHKLDIDSLFDEINGSTNTIKSTQIYLDDEGQTLDVAFKSLTTDTSELQNRVTSQGTQLSAVQGQITSKVWQQDINTATDEMSTQYSTLEQSLNGFQSTVANTYATKTELNELEIGGRNLVQVSKIDSTNNVTTTEEFELRDAWASVFINAENLAVTLEPATEYTISYELELIDRTDVPTPFDMRAGFLIYREGVWIDLGTYAFKEDAVIGDTTTYLRTFTTPTTWNGEQLITYSRRWTTEGSSPIGFDAFKVRNFKIERGNKATDWTPAPEDIENRVYAAETKISQNSESITSIATRTTAVENKFGDYSTTEQMNSAIQQKADSITSTVSNTYATTAALDEATKNRLRRTAIDLTGSEYDQDTYYPICGSGIPYSGYRIFQVNVQLDSYSNPTWSTHDAGFSCNLTARMKAAGWGTVAFGSMGWLDDFSYVHCDKMPAYITQLTNWSVPVLYLRGGGRYYVYVDYECAWEIVTTSYDASGQIAEPTTSPSNYQNLVNNWTDHSNLESARSSIVQLSDRITANVTETTNLGTRMSTVEQTASGLTTRLNTTDTNVTNAAKTATNYLNYSSSGLVVGDMTASTLGKNVRISSSTVDVRNGSTTLASFGADTIYLGKNSETAVINLCNGSATMRSVDDSDFKIYTDKRLVMSAYSSALLDCWRDSTHMTRISMQSADPDATYMWGGIFHTIYQGDIENTFDMSGNTTEFKIINGTTEASFDLNETRLRVQANNTQINCTNGLYVGYDGDYKPAITLGYKSTQAKSIRWYWSDNALHDAFSNSNGQISYVGPGDIGETTTTMVRGQYVRLYAHEGGAVYLGYSGSTAVTSDKNMKSDILDIDDKYMDFFDRLRPITYKYNAPGNKGHRDHVGFIAQEVEDALIASGLTTEQFAGLVIENDITLNPNHDSSLSDEENAANEIHYDTLYSLRYEEFISLLVKKVQSLQEQINQLRDNT